MKEFVYYNSNPLDFPLSEQILVTNSLTDLSPDFIVSNSNDVSAELTAVEIDFYINNSKDKISSKMKNIEKLYELNAIRFDLAQDMVYSKEIENKVLIVCNQEEKSKFLKASLPDEFDLFHVDESIIKSINGNIGNLSVIVDDEGNDVEILVDQIVWFDEQKEGMKQSGCFDPKKSSIDEVISTLRSNISSFEFKKFTTYDKNICQYHERREEICSKCEEVCPTIAIVKHDEEKHLEFSQIDCHGCGGCVSVCPSGAIDYAPSSRETLFEMSKFFKGHIPLIIPSKNMNIKDLKVELKENVLPFSIEGEKFLHEVSLLSLAQESGSQIIFYSDFLSKGTKDSISILNQIYQAKYGVDCIILAMNEKELIQALKDVQFVEGSRYTFNQTNQKKREVFAVRLAHLVENEDLGVVQTGEHVHYAKVNVKESNCTLCLSCVGACNVDALTANVDDNSLRINPSLCTSCGYCEVSCPELDCISLERDVIKLNPLWFKEEILAKDELFACVECGKDFATTKAVEKIAKIMAPIFKADPIKERTLYCCETCKPKIMMASYMKNPNEYNNKQGVAL